MDDCRFSRIISKRNFAKRGNSRLAESSTKPMVIGLADRPHRVADNIEAAEAVLDHALDHPVFSDSLED